MKEKGKGCKDKRKRKKGNKKPVAAVGTMIKISLLPKLKGKVRTQMNANSYF